MTLLSYCYRVFLLSFALPSRFRSLCFYMPALYLCYRVKVFIIIHMYHCHNALF